MEEALNIIEVINNVVVNPNLMSAFIILLFSLANELVAIVPYALILSGQLIFFHEPFSTELFFKLLVFVAFPVGLGSALGSLLLYGLGYFGGKRAIEKFRNRLGFAWQDVENTSKRFSGGWYDELVFFLLRCIPIVPSFPLTGAAGIFRMRFWRYFILTTLGLTVRMMFTLLIVGVGIGSLSELLLFLYNR